MHKREHGDVTTWNTHTLTHTPHQSLHKERYTDAQIKPKVLSKEFVKKRKAGSGMHVNMLHYLARMRLSHLHKSKSNLHTKTGRDAQYIYCGFILFFKD